MLDRRNLTGGKEGGAACQVAAGMATEEATMKWLNDVRRRTNDDFIGRGGHITFVEWSPVREKP
jgi:hypothetical protein